VQQLMFKPLSVSLLFCAVLATPALGFGGFYATPKATDQGASEAQVVIVRDGNRTVMTIAPAVLEDAKELAIVVPVPGKLEERQIHVGDAAVLARLDAYTAPRLVTLRDENPCQITKGLRGQGAASNPAQPEITGAPANTQADFLANDYEISVITPKESLSGWLRKHRLSLSSAAQTAAARYAKAGYSFFVAKVKPPENGNARMLRPLQVAFESPAFVLPLAATGKGQARELV